MSPRRTTGEGPHTDLEVHVKDQSTAPDPLADVKPATDELIANFIESVSETRSHQHPKPGQGEDWYCLNLTSFMGERMGTVLRRLLDAEAQLVELAELRPVPTLRDLIRAARAAGWTHSTAAYSNGRGRPTLPLEHLWERGNQRISYLDGELAYWSTYDRLSRIRRREEFRARVGSVEQAIALLAAYGLPAVTR